MARRAYEVSRKLEVLDDEHRFDACRIGVVRGTGLGQMAATGALKFQR